MTNMHNTVAIDFGHTRTKMAYYNSYDQKIQVMELSNGLEYLPISDIAVIKESEEPIFGEEFEKKFEEIKKDEEQYLIVEGFKSRFTRPIAGNPETPKKVLQAIFGELLNEVMKHPAFNKKEPITAYVTHPAEPIFKKEHRDRLKRAAEQAGFAPVHLVEEPETVIRMFQAEGADLSDHLLILDCGGWTLDICYLRCLEPVFVKTLGNTGGKAGHARVGGKDLDAALVTLLQKKYKDELEKANIAFERAVLASVRRWVRSCKEQYSKNRRWKQNGSWEDIKISSSEHQLSLSLDEQDLTACVEDYIDNVCENVRKIMRSEMDNIEKKLEGKETLSIQLVGGSSRFDNFPETLSDKLSKAFDDKFEIIVSETSPRTEYATVLGALHISTQAEKDIGGSEKSREDKEDRVSFYDAPVSSAAFSPGGEDGELLATAAGESVLLWEDEKLGFNRLSRHNVVWNDKVVGEKKPEPFKVFTDHDASVTSVAFSGDGKYLATASGQVITLRDTKEWAPIEVTPLSESDSTPLDTPDTEESAIIEPAGPSKAITSIAFSPNGAHLASSSKDGTIRLWSIGESEEPKTISSHNGWINSVSWSLHGEHIASAGQDETIQIHTLGLDENPLKISGRHKAPVNCVTYVNLGLFYGKEIRHCLLSGDMDGNIKVWRASDDKAPRSRKYSHHLTQKVHVTPVTSIAPFHNLNNLDPNDVKFQFATGGRDGTIELWSFQTKFLYGLVAVTPVLQFACYFMSSDKLKSYAKLDEHRDEITFLTFSPDQTTLVSGSRDGTVKLWDIEKLTNIRKAKNRNKFSSYKTLSNLAARES